MTCTFLIQLFGKVFSSIFLNSFIYNCSILYELYYIIVIYEVNDVQLSFSINDND